MNSKEVASKTLIEIIDDLLKKDRYQEIDYVEREYLIAFLSFRLDLAIKQNREYESEKSYTVKELFEEYLLGKSMLEFDCTGNPKYTVDDSNYDTFHEHVKDILNLNESKFKGHTIPESMVPIVLFLNKHYKMNLQKKIRTSKFNSVKYNDFEEYINMIKDFYTSSISSKNYDEFELEYLIEETFNFELYKEIASIKHQIDEVVNKELLQLTHNKDVLQRLLYVRMYKDTMLKSVNNWRVQMNLLNDLIYEIQDEFSSEMGDIVYEGKPDNELEFSEEVIRKAKGKLIEKELGSKVKYNKDFQDEDFKAIMKSLTLFLKENNKLINEENEKIKEFLASLGSEE